MNATRRMTVTLLFLCSLTSCTSPGSKPHPTAVQSAWVTQTVAPSPTKIQSATATPTLAPQITPPPPLAWEVAAQPEPAPKLLAFVFDTPAPKLIRGILPMECLQKGLACRQFLKILRTGLGNGILAPVAWSPDGQTLAFTAGADDQHFDVYRMDSQGGALVNLTNSTAPEYDVAWSPSGNYIAFSRDINLPPQGDLQLKKSELWLMRSDGSAPKKLAEGCCLEWLPNDQGLIYIVPDLANGVSDIWVTDLTGQRTRNLTNSPLREQAAAITPDGKFIACIAFDPHTQLSHLYRLDYERGDLVDLTPDFKNISSLSFSPDETRIAFVASAEDGGSEIYITPIDQSGLINLSNFTHRPRKVYDSEPQWISDTQLAFVSDRNNSSNLYVIGSDGSNPKEVLDASLAGPGSGIVALSAWP